MALLRVPGLLLLLLPSLVPALEPLSSSALVAGVSTLTVLLLSRYHCRFMECCPQEGTLNLSALQLDLSHQVYGQPVATAATLNALKTHAATKHPSKPLVLSFHGWPGTGKTFLSSIIAKNLHTKGQGSRFIHVFDATLHFPHVSYLDLYKRQLHQWLYGNLSSCTQSLFIFSEMDHMPHGLVDVIAPFLYHRREGSYGRAIFIFLNNIGGSKINQLALDFWKKSRHRKEMELKDLEPALASAAFKSKHSGFWNSNLIQKNLIDYFVPFLPLERQHVEMCVRTELQSRGYNQDRELIHKILLDLIDFPDSEKIYASRGCKAVSSRIDLYW